MSQQIGRLNKQYESLPNLTTENFFKGVKYNNDKNNNSIKQFSKVRFKKPGEKQYRQKQVSNKAQYQKQPKSNQNNVEKNIHQRTQNSQQEIKEIKRKLYQKTILEEKLTTFNQSQALKKPLLPETYNQNTYALIYWQQRQKAIQRMNLLSEIKKKQIQEEIRQELRQRKKILYKFCPQKKLQVQAQIREYLKQKLNKQSPKKMNQNSYKRLDNDDTIIKQLNEDQINGLRKLINQQRNIRSNQQNFYIKQNRQSSQLKRKYSVVQRQKSDRQSQQKVNKKNNKKQPKLMVKFRQDEFNLNEIALRQKNEYKQLVREKQAKIKFNLNNLQKYNNYSNSQEQSKQYQDNNNKSNKKQKISQQKHQTKRYKHKKQLYQQIQSNRELQKQVSQKLQDQRTDLILENKKFNQQTQKYRKKLEEQKRERKRRLEQKINKELEESQKIRESSRRKVQINQYINFPKKVVKREKDSNDDNRYEKQRQKSSKSTKQLKNINQTKYSNKFITKNIQQKLQSINNYQTQRQYGQQQKYYSLGNKKYSQTNSGTSMYQKFRIKTSQNSAPNIQNFLSNRRQSKSKNKEHQPLEIKLRTSSGNKNLQQNYHKNSMLQINHLKTTNQKIQIIQIKSEDNLQKYLDYHYQLLPKIVKKVNYCHSNINWLVYSLIKETKSFTILQYKKKENNVIGIVIAVCRNDRHIIQQTDTMQEKNNEEIYKDSKKSRKIQLIHVGVYKQQYMTQLIYQCSNYIFLNDPCDQINFSLVYNRQYEQQYELSNFLEQHIKKFGIVLQKNVKATKSQRKYILKRSKFFQFSNIKKDILETLNIPEKLKDPNNGQLYCSVDLIGSEQYLGYEYKNMKVTSQKFILPGIIILFLSQYLTIQKISQIQLQYQNQNHVNSSRQLIVSQQKIRQNYLLNLLQHIIPLKQKFKIFIKNYIFLRAKKFQTPFKLKQELRKQNNRKMFKCMKQLQDKKISCYRYSVLNEVGINFYCTVQNLIYLEDQKFKYQCNYFRFKIDKLVSHSNDNNSISKEEIIKNSDNRIISVVSELYQDSQLYLIPSTKSSYKIMLMNLQQYERLDKKDKNLNEFIYQYISSGKKRVSTAYKIIWLPQISNYNPQNQQKSGQILNNISFSFNKQQQQEQQSSSSQQSVQNAHNVSYNNYYANINNQTREQTMINDLKKDRYNVNYKNNRKNINSKNSAQTYECQQVKVIPNFNSKINTKLHYFHKTYLPNSLIYKSKEMENNTMIKNMKTKNNNNQGQDNSNGNRVLQIKRIKKKLQQQKSQQILIKPPFLIGIMDIKLQTEYNNGVLFAKRIDMDNLCDVNKILKVDMNGKIMYTD